MLAGPLRIVKHLSSTALTKQIFTIMPSTILLFGGSGKVARHLTRLLVSQGSTVHSIIRNPAQSSELSDLGAHPVVQSIEEASVDELAQTIKTCDPEVVVWAAGAGGGNPERTQAVDKEGAIKSFDAAAQGLSDILLSRRWT